MASPRATAPVSPAPAGPSAQAATPRGELSRLAILTAAITRFGRDGYRATSVADIARDAGVSGTLAYAYFPNKQALFLAALDHDAAAAIHEGLERIFDEPDANGWRRLLVFELVDAVERHALARRVLAGLEPDATDRVLEIPALVELRRVCADRLREEQAAGIARADIDPMAIANGSVAIVLSLLMAMLQFGPNAALLYGADVVAVFEAAINAHPA